MSCPRNLWVVLLFCAILVLPKQILCQLSTSTSSVISDSTSAPAAPAGKSSKVSVGVGVGVGVSVGLLALGMLAWITVRHRQEKVEMYNDDGNAATAWDEMEGVRKVDSQKEI
jgi:hypothetical protein